jgi:predicted RNA-binding protein YlqC (UPF0109 family)
MGRVHGNQEVQVRLSSSVTDSANLIPAPIATAVLDHVVRSIVDNPDAVVVEGSADGDKVLLEVRVGEGDLGRVIGRRGRTAMSIRTVVRAAATRDGVNVDVDFVDN